MANTVGPLYSLNDTSIQTRSVVPEFDLLTWTQTPFLKYISGGTEEQPSLNNLSEPGTAMKYEWLERSDPAYTTTLSAAIAAVDTATMTLTDPVPFIAGTVVKVDTELIWVKTTANGANTVPIERGVGGSVAAAHANGSTVTIVGSAILETQDAPGSWNVDTVLPYNYFQYFSEVVAVTELQQAIEKYGIQNAIEESTKQKSRVLYRKMNRTCFYGGRAVGTSTVPYLMGGIDSFIASANKTNLTGASLTTKDIEDLMQTIFDTGGGPNMPTMMVCNSFVRRKISEIYSTGGINVYRDQSARRGGVMVDVIDTHFGSLDILVDTDCPPSSLYLLKGDKLGFGPLKGAEMKREQMAKTGPSDKFMIYGAYTLEVRASSNHGYIYNISTTA